MPVLNNAGGFKAGDIAHFAKSSAPAGWLKANGALVSRTTYAALFNQIGTTFGAGDGSTTFALPDLRGEFIRGLDDGRGVDSGRALGSAQLDQMQTITGAFESQGPLSCTVSGAFSGSVMAANDWTGSGGASTKSKQSYQFSSANSSGARAGTETRARNIALLACIKF